VAEAVRTSLGGLGGVQLAGEDRVVVTASQLFAPGEAKLTPAGEATLAPLATRLRRVVGEAPPAAA
jgi:hypothetical protein